MPIDANNHPEFPDSVHTLIADSLLNLLKNNPLLDSFFNSEINGIESQTIRELGIKRARSLWVYILDDAEEALPSGMAFVVTTISILLVDSAGRINETRQNLYRRVIAYIQAFIHQQLDLRDVDGNQITDSTIQFNRIEAAEIADTDQYFVIELQCVFGSTIVQVTQLPEGL